MQKTKQKQMYKKPFYHVLSKQVLVYLQIKKPFF